MADKPIPEWQQKLMEQIVALPPDMQLVVSMPPGSGLRSLLDRQVRAVEDSPEAPESDKIEQEN